MPSKIFINYRREDSIAIAGRLHDRLAEAFGRDNLFMDVDNIPIGINFEEYLKSQVAGCDVILSIIGPNWLNASDETNQRRLDKPDDFVAIEIAAALARNILVIPVLVDGTHMPKASELPASLKPLALRNAIQVRNTNFGSDAEQLITKMREALALGRLEQTQDLVRSFAAHLNATLLLNIGVFIVALNWFFLKNNNYAGMLATVVAVQPFFWVGWRTLNRDESVRRFGLVTSVGGLLVVAAIIVSGQFFGVALFENPDLQKWSLVIGLCLLFPAMFFGVDQKPPFDWGPGWMKKLNMRVANSRWLAGLQFFLCTMLFMCGTWGIFQWLTDSVAAVLALVGAQLLVVGYCYARYRKALAANPAPVPS
jgi:hypothetical protein